MTQPNFLILYVGDVAASASFYAGLLDGEPVEQSPNFAMFALTNGSMLGLWNRAEVKPAATSAGGIEIGWPLAGDAEVDSTCADWRARGIAIAQEPTLMDFGRTFVGLDPDGHRLRVFAPA